MTKYKIFILIWGLLLVLMNILNIIKGKVLVGVILIILILVNGVILWKLENETLRSTLPKK